MLTWIKAGRAAGLFSLLMMAGAGQAAMVEPLATTPSNLLLSLRLVANIASEGYNNLASPVAVGSHLYIVDQENGEISILNGSTQTTKLRASSLTDVTPSTQQKVINMAGRGSTAYVAVTSSTLPAGFATPSPLPADERYQTTETRYELIYRFDRGENGSLSNPQPVTAFLGSTNGGAHTRGAMLVLPDNRLVYTRGDNQGAESDGLSAPQDPTSTLGAMLLIDGQTKEVQVAAKGLRNVQQMNFVGPDKIRIAFSDIGRTVAEEINVIEIDDLSDITKVENFGWGRNADRNAREGTFYIDDGQNSSAMTFDPILIEVPEPGFISPYAQFGREDQTGFFAVSGPIASTVSFTSIDLLFGDLVSGTLYATKSPVGDVLNEVFRVSVVDALGEPTTLKELLRFNRADLRLFNFADGGAGLLLEQMGDLYRLSEVTIAAIPLPSALLLLGSGCLVLLRLRRRQILS